MRGHTVHPPVQVVTGLHAELDGLKVYPAKQLVQAALLLALHVAHGDIQLGKQVKD